MNFIDIHAHVLPGIDDGARSLAETLRMLRMAYTAGTRALVATPHAFLPAFEGNSREAIERRFAATCHELLRLATQPDFGFLEDLELHLGAENNLSPEFLEALATRRVLTIAGGSYLLLEFSDYLALQFLHLAVDRVINAGFIPVLAHVERYAIFREKPQRLADFLEKGCVSQVNGTSVLGRRGRSPSRSILALLRRGLVHVIASDAHDCQGRNPDLQRVSAILKSRFSERRVRAWMVDNPCRILHNQPRIEVS